MRTNCPARVVALVLALVTFSAGTASQAPPALRRIAGLEYPRLAALARVQGKVEMLAVISPEGRVGETRVLSGHGLLTQAAREALSRWLFTGCAAGGGQCSVKVVFSFALDGECDRSHCATDFLVDLPGSVFVSSKAPRPIID